MKIVTSKMMRVTLHQQTTKKKGEECKVDHKIVDDYYNSVYVPSDFNTKCPKFSTQQEVSLSLSPIDDSSMTGSLGRQVLPDVDMEKYKGDNMNTQDTLTLKESPELLHMVSPKLKDPPELLF